MEQGAVIRAWATSFAALAHEWSVIGHDTNATVLSWEQILTEMAHEETQLRRNQRWNQGTWNQGTWNQGAWNKGAWNKG
jgi:hypothetical protein